MNGQASREAAGEAIPADTTTGAALMKWSRRSPHSIQAGEWVISRAKVQGSDNFTLWRGTERVSDHDTAAKAKAAAAKESA